MRKSVHVQVGVQSQNVQEAVRDRLVDGEDILKTAHIHWGIFWQTGAVFVVALLFCVFVAKELGLMLLIVTVLMGAYAAARRSVYLLVLTNKRMLMRYGILQTDVVDIHFDKIESIELERMPTGYLMGYSNVVIMGTGQRIVIIPYVSNGPEIRKAYSEIVLGDKT